MLSVAPIDTIDRKDLLDLLMSDITGNERRLREKLRALLESAALPAMFNLVENPLTPANVLVAAFKELVAAAGIGGRQADGVPQGSGFSVNINITGATPGAIVDADVVEVDELGVRPRFDRLVEAINADLRGVDADADY